MDSYLQLKEFRRKNNLTQTQVAEFLNVSKAFICTVEKGGVRLPDDKIDAILFDSDRFGWDTSPLVPAYHRLLIAASTIKTNPGLGKDGSNPFELAPSTIVNIRHAKQGITTTMVDSICASYCDIDRNYLLQGGTDELGTELVYNEKYLNDIALRDYTSLRQEEQTNITRGIFAELKEIRLLLTDIKNEIISSEK